MERQGEFGPTLRPRRNLLHKTNNIFRGSRHRVVIVAPLLIRLQLQQLRSELGDSGDGFVRGNARERVLEASADLHEIVPDSGQSLQGGGIAGGGGGSLLR